MTDAIAELIAQRNAALDRAEVAEAKVAAVTALADEWEHALNIASPLAPLDADLLAATCRDLRAALADQQPTGEAE